MNKQKFFFSTAKEIESCATCATSLMDKLKAARIMADPEVEYRFEERAAILEYDGGFDRAEAERMARGA